MVFITFQPNDHNMHVGGDSWCTTSTHAPRSNWRSCIGRHSFQFQRQRLGLHQSRIIPTRCSWTSCLNARFLTCTPLKTPINTQYHPKIALLHPQNILTHNQYVSLLQFTTILQYQDYGHHLSGPHCPNSAQISYPQDRAFSRDRPL